MVVAVDAECGRNKEKEEKEYDSDDKDNRGLKNPSRVHSNHEWKYCSKNELSIHCHNRNSKQDIHKDRDISRSNERNHNSNRGAATTETRSTCTPRISKLSLKYCEGAQYGSYESAYVAKEGEM